MEQARQRPLHPYSGSFDLTKALFGSPESTYIARLAKHYDRSVHSLNLPRFYPYLSGWENLALLATLRGVSQSDTVLALERVGLSARAHEKVRKYSLGMRQRLAIAAVILHRHSLLILDELTNGLDPQGIFEVRTLLGTLAHEGQAILLCSRALAEVEQVCTHVLVLAQGRALIQGSLSELLTSTSQAVLRTPDLHRACSVLQSLPWVNMADEHSDLPGEDSEWQCAPPTSPSILSITRELNLEQPSHQPTRSGKLHIRVPRGRESELASILFSAEIPIWELCWSRESLEAFSLAATATELPRPQPRRARSGWFTRWFQA